MNLECTDVERKKRKIKNNTNLIFINVQSSDLQDEKKKKKKKEEIKEINLPNNNLESKNIEENIKKMTNLENNQINLKENQIIEKNVISNKVKLENEGEYEIIETINLSSLQENKIKEERILPIFNFEDEINFLNEKYDFQLTMNTNGFYSSGKIICLTPPFINYFSKSLLVLNKF
jgi:hypothetical protein